MASAVSASTKAQITREANQALVAELLTLPFAEQAEQIAALRPTTRMRQVGIQLAKALLIKADFMSKPAEEREAFRLSLPPLHRHYIQMALAVGIPSSATKKKSRSLSANKEAVRERFLKLGLPPKTLKSASAASAAASAASGNSPRAAAEAEPSELDKRIKVFRRTGLLFSYLYELTGEEEDREGSQNYGNYTIKAKGDDSDEHLVSVVTAAEEGDEEGRPLAIKALRKIFQDRVAHAITHLRGLLKDRKMTLHKVVADIKRHLSPIAVNIDLAELDDKLALNKYMNTDERHRLAVLLTRSEFGTYAQKPTVLASLLEFLEPIVKRLALRKSHGKTRKSQYGLKSKSASANANAAEKVYLKKQMSILGKQDLTWTQKQNALRVLGNERKTYFESVPFTGPLRDSKGYKQHHSECSTDVISQVLQQGMPWGAPIQERLYNGTAAEFSAMYDKAVKCPGVHPDREDMIALLLNMQERFKLHYTAAKKLEDAAACVPPFDYTKIGPILTRKVRKSAELGPSIKGNIKKLTNASLYSTFTPYVQHVFQLLFQFFGMFFGVNDIQCYTRNVRFGYRQNPIGYLNYDIQYKNYKHLAFAFRINHYPPNRVTYQTRPSPDVVGHFTAIYLALDGSWVYYDNEVGILPLHKTLMGDILNERTSAWFIGFVYKIVGSTTTLTFYKIPYFNSANLQEMKNKTIAEWHGDSWHEVYFRDIADVPAISTIEDHIHIVSKTTKTPGFEGLYIDDA